MGVSALYPRPPQPQEGALGGNALSLIPTILSLKQFGANQAVGQAFQGAMGANGQFDPNAAMSAISKNPAAALGAPGATAALLDARGKNIANATASVGLEATKNTALAQYLAGFGGKTLSPQDVNTMRAGAVRLGGDPTTFGAITTPQQAMAAVKNAQIYGAGAGAGITPTAASPDQNLAPTVTTAAEAARGGPGAAGAGVRVVGASPVQAADQAAYNADRTTAPETLKNMRPLQQALPLISKLSSNDFGPGSPELSQLKGLLVTAGIMDPNSSSLPTRQEAQKYLNQFVGGLPHASDLGLTQDKISKPNFDITQPANVALIKNAIAMSRMDAAAPAAAGSGQDYLNKKSQYYNGMDPRAFQIDMMSDDEIRNLQKTVTGPARTKFNNSLRSAIKAGVITPQLTTPEQ